MSFLMGGSMERGQGVRVVIIEKKNFALFHVLDIHGRFVIF